MNNVTMTGNLTRDPEPREYEGRSECKLRLAVDNGPYPPTFIDVRTFDAQADACATYLAKGRRVGVAGKLALDEFVGSDGTPRQRYSVIGRVEFLDGRRPGDEVDSIRGGGGEGGRPAEAEPTLALVV
jgi:single-strand DNA-binding protein